MSVTLDLLSALGSVASIVSLTEQHVRMMEGPHYRSDPLSRQTPPIIAAVRPDQIVRASKAYGKGEANLTVQAVDLSQVSELAVKALVERLVRTEAEAAKKLAGPSYSLSELQELVDELKSEVCAVLRMIKQLHGGKLPGQPLYDKWTRFSCG